MAKKVAVIPVETSDFTVAVRQALSKVVHSATFQPAERLQSFLTYVVTETLRGRNESLKEYSIGVDVFGKDPAFDPRMDPIVRVQARRLRMRLDSYYGEEGRADDLVIDLAKGGYTPTFRAALVEQPKKVVVNSPVSRNSVAVMPFSDDSPSADQAWFCNGLSHEILSTLSELKFIVVTTDSHFPGQESRCAAIRISGDVRKSNDVLRITSHIADTSLGCYVWTGSIDRKMTDLFALQEEVARVVVKKLRSHLQDSAPNEGNETQNSNPAANNAYLQGRYHQQQRTEHGLRKALEFFTEAVEAEPEMAEAYAGLADTYNLSAHYGVCTPAEVWSKAASNAAHAVELDDASSAGHTSVAHIMATQDWDWAGAEREFCHAINLSPRNAMAHHWYAVACLAPQGRLVEAMEEIKLAQKLDPLSSIIARDIALLYYYYQRNYDLALEQCDRTIEQNPHFAPVYWTLGLVQEQRGEYEEAVAAFRRAIELSPLSPRILGAMASALAKSGKEDEARRILAELREQSAKRYISPFELALIHFNLGEINEGFTSLTKAFSDRCVEVINLQLDPRFDSVRADARFKSLISRLKLA